MSLVYCSSESCVQLALETGRLKSDFSLEHSLTLHEAWQSCSAAATCMAMLYCLSLDFTESFISTALWTHHGAAEYTSGTLVASTVRYQAAK